MKKYAVKNFILSLLLVCAAAGLILYPEEISTATQDGLHLCIHILFPSLFPFFILSSLFITCGTTKKLEQFLAKLMLPIFHLPGSCITPFVLGAIGGYPTGAKAAVSLYQNNQCTKLEAERLLSFCNNCGPAFILSTVGYGCFGNLKYGFLLLVTHLLSAIATGIIFSPRRCNASHTVSANIEYKPVSFSLAFVYSVKDSMRAFLDLASFVLCFSAAVKLLQLSGIPSFIGAFLPLSGNNAEKFLLGILELTRGVTNLSAGNDEEKLILSAALLGWGGLSVHCQVLSLLQETELSSSFYFKGKATQSIVAAALTALALNRSHILLTVILLPFILILPAKKAVEKKRRVYYNKKNRPRELWYHEPVPEKNRAALRLLRTRKDT